MKLSWRGEWVRSSQWGRCWRAGRISTRPATCPLHPESHPGHSRPGRVRAARRRCQQPLEHPLPRGSICAVVLERQPGPCHRLDDPQWTMTACSGDSMTGRLRPRTAATSPKTNSCLSLRFATVPTTTIRCSFVMPSPSRPVVSIPGFSRCRPMSTSCDSNPSPVTRSNSAPRATSGAGARVTTRPRSRVTFQDFQVQSATGLRGKPVHRHQRRLRAAGHGPGDGPHLCRYRPPDAQRSRRVHERRVHLLPGLRAHGSG